MHRRFRIDRCRSWCWLRCEKGTSFGRTEWLDSRILEGGLSGTVNQFPTAWSHTQEIFQQKPSGIGQDAFRMKLNPLDRIAAMAQAHDGLLAIVKGFSTDLKFGRKVLLGHDE